MDVEKALEIVSTVCREFRGNLEDHTTIQQALSVLREKLTVKPKIETAEESD